MVKYFIIYLCDCFIVVPKTRSFKNFKIYVGF